MKPRTLSTILALAAAVTPLPESRALAQTTPTGTITGHVEDAQGGLLPGVTVTATSPSLQRTRSAITSSTNFRSAPSSDT